MLPINLFVLTHPPEARSGSSGRVLAENMVFPKLGVILALVLALVVFPCSKISL